MATSVKPILSDKAVYPTDEIVFSIIGDNRSVWEKTMSYLQENYPAGTREWRYYNDGKQWLFKFLFKKKTIFWLSLISGTFRITFYLGGNAESLITVSTLSEDVKAEFLRKEFSGPFRPVTIIVKRDSDLDNIRKLIDMKVSQK